MVKVPEWINEHIDGAFPKNVCLVATVSSDGMPSIGPKGSVMVYDDETLAFWERAMRGAWDNLRANPNVTVFFRNPELRETGLLPGGGAARFWGTAEVHADGPIREAVWDRVVQAEKDRDPDKIGAAILVRVTRAEHLNGNPLE